MTAADPVGALVALLKADAGVSALTTRVFGQELPAAEVGSMPRLAVVIAASGGAALTAGSYAEHEAQRVDVFCYGATLFQAEGLRRAVHAALKQIRRNGDHGALIHWAQPAGGFATRRDPDADWPMSFSSFQLFYAEQGVG